MIGLFAVLVVLFSLGATVAMAAIAGVRQIEHVLLRFDPIWLPVLLGGLVVSFFGYRLAFERMVWNDDGHGLTVRQRFEVVAAGFGAFVHRGGTAVDRYVMRATGVAKREGDVRLAALQSLEMVPIAVGAFAAACIAVFVGGPTMPSFGFDIPWIVGPLVGAPLALGLVFFFRRSLRTATGWRYWIGVALDGLWMLQAGVMRERRRRLAVLGMAVFTFGELVTVWSAMAAFGFRMSVVGVVLGYGVGYVVSRRSAPLGGAGLIDVMLIVALWSAGAPLAVAIVGTFVYRFFNLWCSIPVALASLRSLRGLAPASAATGGGAG